MLSVYIWAQKKQKTASFHQILTTCYTPHALGINSLALHYLICYDELKLTKDVNPMKILLFSFQLFIPLTMLIIGFLFSQHAPKTINPVWGYRTTRSMKNKDTWEWVPWGSALSAPSSFTRECPTISVGVFLKNGASIYSYSPF